mgnify:CR=1 FL=1
MANCSDLTLQQVPGLEVLSYDTIVSFALTRGSCKSYKIVATTFSVIDFSLALNVSGITSFTTVVSFYRVESTGLVALAGLQSTDLSIVFSKEFNAGTYVMCVETPAFFTAQVSAVARYRGYVKQIVFDLDFPCGEYTTAFIPTIRPPQVCTRPLFFRIVDGKLPPGFRMTSLGRVAGRIDELDCLEDTYDLPPSQNWSYTNFDGRQEPWGRRWGFRVEVSIQGMPDIRAYEWFCVKIYNNWDKDRDNFLAQAPFRNKALIVGVEPAVTIPVLCPAIRVDESAKNFEPVAIPTLCPTLSFEAAKPAAMQAEPCGKCEGKEVVESSHPIPFGLPDAQPQFFASWLSEVEARSKECSEFSEFAKRLLNDPLVDQYKQKAPVVVKTVDRKVVMSLAVDDPTALWWRWRNEETSRLPPWALVQEGAYCEASLDTKPRA